MRSLRPATQFADQGAMRLLIFLQGNGMALDVPNLEVALSYVDRGFSIVPQLPGSKQPRVKWQPYQAERPSREEVVGWWTTWPEAGIAIILGPVSGLFVIDVDGEEAHGVLVERLGAEPVAPKVLSGSGEPFRYHLYFKYPFGVATKAKSTPWHTKLEFRGERGIVIAPPSLHKSGRPYVWEAGRSLQDMPLPGLPEMIRAALEQSGAEQTNAASTVPLDAADLIDAQRKARAYLLKMPPAIEGSGGDKQTFTVACTLVLGFALSPEQALPLLMEYNGRCQPPWDGAELRRKLDKANELTGARGYLLSSAPPRNSQEAAPLTSGAGPSFPMVIPDFMWSDWSLVKPRPARRNQEGRLLRGRRSVFGGVSWLERLLIIMQSCSRIVMPDIVAAGCVWGVDRPLRWRRRLSRFLFGSETPWRRPAKPCASACPLYGRRGPRHRHWTITFADPEKFIGCLSYFTIQQGVEANNYDFRPPRKPRSSDMNDEKQYQIKLRDWEGYKRRQQSGRLVSVYLPVLLFGPSPRSGLTGPQQKILRALTREITRGQSTRKDKALVVTGGQAASGREEDRSAPCPYLGAGERFVCFNGNGGRQRRSLRGRGYSLSSWLSRAGYEVTEDARQQWKAVRRLLRDVSSLPGPFGIIAGGRHRNSGEWRSLDQMRTMTNSAAGRAWLTQCRLRLFTPEDYLVRWRQYFADRLGFSSIPGDDEGAPAPKPEQQRDKIESADDLDRWMREEGLSDRQVAELVGCSRSLVSRLHSGSKRWSAPFQEKLAAALAGRPSGRVKPPAAS